MNIRENLYRAAISCGHEITEDQIILYADTRKEGNALSQLADRLEQSVKQLEQELIQVQAELAEAKKDQARLDWLESQCVEVRVINGQFAKFHAQQIYDDCEPYKTDLRAQVDAAIKESNK